MIDINTLHPAIRTRAYQFLAKSALKGINLRITFGMRTFQQQQDLYDQGRTKPGLVVTKAKPGQSFHNYGLAIDVCPVVDGKFDWESKRWTEISDIGKSLGFSWGGDWKNFRDIPHFEYPPNFTYRNLLALKNSGEIDKDGFVILPSV